MSLSFGGVSLTPLLCLAFQYRVRPFPDPSRVDETTWLTKDEIMQESMKNSTSWVEAGSGDQGKLYVEVLGCTNLPPDRSDAFACLVFEECIVNTDVISKCKCPRWPPWCRRSFIFNISHPTSVLFLAVFDFNPESLQAMNPFSPGAHSPIGRIQLHLSNFQPETVCTLFRTRMIEARMRLFAHF